nr:LPS export ABC transporter permease LptG [Paracoccus sp. S-4012]
MLLTVGIGFVAILFFVELVEQVRRFGGAGVGLGGAAALSALLVPGTFYTILPLIVLLAGMGMFLALSRSSELVAIRASGRSALRFLAAPSAVAVLVGLLAVAFLNPIVAATVQRYGDAADALDRGRAQTVSVAEDSLWLRQALGDGGGQVVIRAERASRDATTLYDATFLVFDAQAGPLRRLIAREARLVPGAWQLADVKVWPLAQPNPEAVATTAPTLELPSDLTAERIRDAFGAPEAVPIWQLPQFIAGMERAGFSAQRHRVWLHTELARPALLAAMVLIAAAFTMHHVRGQRTGGLILAAFAAGLGLFFLRHFAQVLGDNGDIPPALAAWVPPAAGTLLALGRLLRLEDG